MEHEKTSGSSLGLCLAAYKYDQTLQKGGLGTCFWHHQSLLSLLPEIVSLLISATSHTAIDILIKFHSH